MPDTSGKQPVRLRANSFIDQGVINGNYTGQLYDIQVWDYAFTNQEVSSLFDIESKMLRQIIFFFIFTYLLIHFLNKIEKHNQILMRNVQEKNYGIFFGI